MTSEQRTSNRHQLLFCLSQLAARAEELDEVNISLCIHTLCGSIASYDDKQFSYMCEAFSRMQLDQMKKEDTIKQTVIDNSPPQS